MIHLTINGKALEVPEGTTLFDAAAANGIRIPSLCRLPEIHEFGTCRICSVEVAGARTLQAACITLVAEGMVVQTNTQKVRNARKVLYELILSDHSKDCLACRRNQSCELQALGRQLGVETSRFEGEQSERIIDESPSITRDMSKCILCRRCVTVCNDIQGEGILNAQHRGFSTVVGPADELPLGAVNCAFCGQCTVVCPVGALKETDSTRRVWEALGNPALRTVVQVAPAVRVALGEEFGMAPGTPVTGKLAAALRALGFNDVFDTDFAADLTILEEGTELLERLRRTLADGGDGAGGHPDRDGGRAETHGAKPALPMVTSCSPGWIKHVEHAWPDALAHLSTCKSPHTMLGALAKGWWASRIGRRPEEMYVVSVMPCTAKKFEIIRPEMKNDGVSNVDAVLTTRELAAMIKEAGIDFANLPDEAFDKPLGISTGAAAIFGLTGGVMEAALRTVHELVTGRELPFEKLHVTPIVGLAQVKEATLRFENPLPAYGFLSGVEVRIAVTSGLSGANRLMAQVARGESPYHFIEVMGCPGGCITGGGQPRSVDPQVRMKRLSGLYAVDEGMPVRKSHENQHVTDLYKEYLMHPGSPVAHEYLHTRYVPRGRFGGLDGEVCGNAVPTPVESRRHRGWSDSAPGPADRTAVPEVLPGAPGRTESLRAASERDAARLQALEAENLRLRGELAEAQETVDIMKQVVAERRPR